MENSIVSGDDTRFLVTQPESEITNIVGQMTTLMESITSLQEDTDDKVETMAKQGWFKRMWATVSGKNKATKQEIQKNQDKVVGYISQSVAQLYQMNCINQQVMCSLGNRMNEVYMQVTNMYNDQLSMKSQLSEIKAIQQQTLEAMGAFVNKLNEKIESVDNFHMLISEIQNGMYKDSSKLYSLCMILAQLDKRTLDDARKVNLLQSTLKKAGIVTDEEISILQCLQDIVALPQEKVGAIYIELCTFRNSFPANLFADMIEQYHYLTKMERMSKKKEVLIQRVLDKYELDADASFPICEVVNSFIENKQESLISLQDVKMLESTATSNQSSSDEEKIYDICVQLEEEENYSKLVEFVRPLAEQGSMVAQWKFGNCYRLGQGVQKDCRQAVEWYRKSAEQGDARAQCNLGACYYFGEGVSQDYKQAVEWYRKAIEQGDARAQRNLGNCYRLGHGVQKDCRQAVEWYRKSAEQGNADAQYDLGNCYYFGHGVSKDYRQAVDWYRKSAEQGIKFAQDALGDCYYFGEGVSKDYRQAVDWYRKAAQQGNAHAQSNLGDCYRLGNGVQQDYKQAVEWYRKAAEQGYVQAQNMLGNCYYFGHGVSKDYRQALDWYRKSAEQGNANAQFVVGEFYYRGIGITKNLAEAKKYYRLSADQGEEDAIKMCRKLKC